MDKEVIDMAVDKKFSEFADNVKNSLKQKLVNHEVIKQYTADIEHVDKLKQAFTDINKE